MDSRIISSANQALDALRTLYGKPLLADMVGSQFLSQRAMLMGLEARGQRSANGSCHLWPCRDGKWLALNLSRPQDWDLLPALFQQNLPLTNFQAVADKIAQQTADVLLTQGRLLGLAVAVIPCEHLSLNSTWFSITARGNGNRSDHKSPKVLDLSALWAGPLCSHLLQQCGARVTKVESLQRPDGARLNQQPGAKNFYQQLNHNKELYLLDFQSTRGLRELDRLISEADIVIEGSRPRALQQLGIHAEKIVASTPGKIWISITAYGRSEPEANWIGYGDDVAIAAGFCRWNNELPEFIGDAIADPLTGLYAALTAYMFWQKNESALLDVSLYSVARYCAN